MTIFLQYEVIEYEYIIFQNQVLPIAHYYLELPLMTSLVTLIILLMSKSSEAEQSASNSFIILTIICSFLVRLSYTISSKETSRAFAILTNVGRLTFVAPRSICEILDGSTPDFSPYLTCVKPFLIRNSLILRPIDL